MNLMNFYSKLIECVGLYNRVYMQEMFLIVEDNELNSFKTNFDYFFFPLFI